MGRQLEDVIVFGQSKQLATKQRASRQIEGSVGLFESEFRHSRIAGGLRQVTQIRNWQRQL
jgi:hypothetical protein